MNCASKLPASTGWSRPTARELRGRFVLLRKVDPAVDAGPLFHASHGTPEVESLWRYMGYGPFSGEAEMRSWMTACAASADPLFFTVLDVASGRPIGMTSFLNIVPDAGRLEIGHIWYVPGAQRTRANTEAAYLLLGHAFDALGYRRVEWKCDAENERSRQAALRLGFRPEGVFRKHLVVKGRNRDTAWYAMLDDEWPRVRESLVTWLYRLPAGSNSLSSLQHRPPGTGEIDPRLGPATTLWGLLVRRLVRP